MHSDVPTPRFWIGINGTVPNSEAPGEKWSFRRSLGFGRYALFGSTGLLKSYRTQRVAFFVVVFVLNANVPY